MSAATISVSTSATNRRLPYCHRSHCRCLSWSRPPPQARRLPGKRANANSSRPVPPANGNLSPLAISFRLSLHLARVRDQRPPHDLPFTGVTLEHEQVVTGIAAQFAIHFVADVEAIGHDC